MTDFFDLPSENFVKSQSSGGRSVDTNIYKPDPDSFGGVYKAVFRFLPYIFDKSTSKYTKYSAKFWNPLTKESLWVDCPSNVDKPSILWDLERVIRSLKDEEPDLHAQLSSQFSRWHSHYSPIYIKKDMMRPELEGSVKLFKFTAQINNLIESQINPEEDDLLDSAKSVNPYHLLEGKDFLCVVSKKTRQFRDWSKCKFMDEVTPLVYNIGDKQLMVENNEKSVKLIQEFLKKNTPSLDDYKHVEWDSELKNKVAEAIISLITNKSVMNMLFEKSRDEEMKNLIKSKMGGSKNTTSTSTSTDTSSNDTSDDLLSDELEFSSSTSETKAEVASSSNEKDEYDELFDNM